MQWKPSQTSEIWYVDETMDMTCKESNIWNDKLARDIFGQVNDVEDALTLFQFMGPENTTQLTLPVAIIEDDVCMSPAVSVSFDDTFNSDVDIARIFHNENDDTMTCYCVSAFHCECDKSY